MGTYGLNAEEIADAMADVEQNCEGDFYEEDFIKGAKIYLQRLRQAGAFIYSEKADKKGKMCKECGADKDECKKLKTHEKGELKDERQR